MWPKRWSVAGDWRLPNIRELQSLVDFSNNNPALPDNHPFYPEDALRSSPYWSSTSTSFRVADFNMSWYSHGPLISDTEPPSQQSPNILRDGECGPVRDDN